MTSDLISRDQLLAVLNAERLDQTWWPTPPRLTRPEAPITDVDNDIATARRRRDAVQEAAAHHDHETEVC